MILKPFSGTLLETLLHKFRKQFRKLEFAKMFDTFLKVLI